MIDLNHLYSRPMEGTPVRIGKNQHTMHWEHFTAYVQKTKFSEAQRALLRRATDEKWPVTVFGAYVGHREHLLAMNKARLIDSVRHFKEGRKFNGFRPEFLHVEITGNSVNNALWVIAFPSREYVTQVAELVQAYMDLLDACLVVKVVYFSECQETLTDWSGLGENLQQYIREGEVVVIGNVDLMKDQLMTLGFQDRFEGWRSLGLDEMYAISSMIHKVSHRRLVLLGAGHTFWGSASGLIAQAAIRCGAQHILYCSKAGTLIEKQYIHHLFTPTHFAVAVHEPKAGWRIEYVPLVAREEELAYQLTDAFGISSTGIHLTVPTVIGETREQADAYQLLHPATIDCEDGYIAKAVHQEQGAGVRFLPIHFITDYVKGTRNDRRRPHSSLAIVTEEERQRVKAQKQEAFANMARVVAMYSVIYGAVDRLYLDLGTRMASRANDGRFPGSTRNRELFDRVLPYVDNNYPELAINILQRGRTIRECDADSLFEIATICQKHGLLEDAMVCLNLLCEAPEYKREGSDFRLHCRVLELKVFSQAGSFRWVYGEYRKILAELDSSALRKSLLCPTLHRAGIAAAMLDQHDECDQLFAGSREWTQQNGLFHAEASCELFSTYAQALCLNGLTLAAAIERLLKAQRHYLQEQPDRKASQANVFRAFAEALVGEAVLYLRDHDPRTKKRGYARVAAFQLLTKYCGANERSEALSELLHCCRNYSAEVLRVLRTAMAEHWRRSKHIPYEIDPHSDAAEKISEFANFHMWNPGDRFDRARELLTRIDEGVLGRYG